MAHGRNIPGAPPGFAGIGIPAVGDVLTGATGGRYAAVPLLFWGDGSDGNVTVSGAVSLSRDMYYATLTLVAGGAINTNGWRIFVCGVLDLTAADSGAIFQTATPGNDASGVTGGAALTLPVVAPTGLGSINILANATLAPGRSGTANAAGTAGFGGGSITAASQQGGPAGVAGAGGAGSSLAGGAGAPNSTLNQRGVVARSLAFGIMGTANSFRGGDYAPSGGSGGGDAGGAGGGSGSPGLPGPCIGIFARALLVSSSNPNAGIIRAKGSQGGKGGTPPGFSTGRGGGAGAPGTGGGFVLMVVGGASGGTHANAIDVTGGPGGDAGLGTGTGANGTPGTAAYGGAFSFINLSKTTPQTQVTVTTKYTVGGTAGVGTTGGLATTAQIDLVAA